MSTADNVAYLTGYQSVMDGWHLPEPISAVFLPTSPELPMTLFLPEASLIGLVVAEREGQGVAFDRLRTFDLLNFCVTARSEDVHLELAADLQAELARLAKAVDGACAPNIVAAAADCLKHLGVTDETVLFDDMRMAQAAQQACGQRCSDGLDTMFAARAIKTDEEIALFRESGVKADRVMAFTVSQLGRGRSWADVEKAVAHFMIDEDIDPLPTSPMLFGGSYDAIFKPDLFRTRFDTPFSGGEIAILETQGRYRNFWIDINRTAHIGEATAAYREQHAIVQRCFEEVVSRLRPGANSAEICEPVRCGLARELDAPEKLLMIVHSIGRVPLESPVAFPSTGLHAATEGFEIEPNMVLSFDALYFGSRLGPSHMENVFVIGEDATESIYSYPLELIETD
ncbi:M24 family metallopeptidase [Seongchinamella unica]|uniref:M24 family metallopeptidase n=1 Tax=Seongchinamella unica TaxID=2547392 RepID=A0A4R5LRA7_9GAMM|nr:M24 family metallopeptidase [Seongchinamella unica]TDG13316.1 M24 family metallopeptidase [Seongchinamella unica]